MIILVRHGQTIWNKLGKRQGHLNSPLTALGKIQAQRNGEKIAKHLKDHGIDEFKFFASPLERAYSSAKIIAAELGVWPDTIKRDDRLREMSYGRWEGKRNALVEQLHPEDKPSDHRHSWQHKIPYGESHALVRKRISPWLQETEQYGAVISVAHGVLNNAIRGLYLNLSPEETMSLHQSNDSVYVLQSGKEYQL